MGLKLIEFYETARSTVLNSEYAHEVDRYKDRRFENIDSKEFMRCYAWVVLNTRMQEEIIRGRFSEFCDCFDNWENLEEILSNEANIISKACQIFNHKRKVESIFQTLKIIREYGNFENFKEWIKSDPINNLGKLPYIGKITKEHLGRNLGFDFSTASQRLSDRH